MNRIKYATLLFAEPSLWEGFARVLDIGGTFGDYNDADSAEEADAIAQASDWHAVGADLQRAIDRFQATVGQGNE